MVSRDSSSSSTTRNRGRERDEKEMGTRRPMRRDGHRGVS
ncbi:hypothetical protein HSB1_25770 [Halogranum salarium B-1]|uniref:Uncharacterized protein n=1 Tax=Halogranum salarium B-1 TaxID=1210908 RepID=J3JFE1_9EURY|nr:hypothetical protein HSB1_25770 [Halogranum salarium B-1]